MASCLALAVVLLARVPSALGASFPDAHDPPTAGWSGPVFKLSQDYPTSLPTPEQYPWKQFDFATQPNEYIRAVLAYATEGNIGIDWVGQSNTVRKWYHAPWLHAGQNGREFIHGLTRERSSRPGELHPNQVSTFGNYAVGLYNAPGGYVIGQVWADPAHPDASKAQFPDGTVSIKLLFTAATVKEVPYLKKAFRWQGHVAVPGDNTRAVRWLRLLQIDVAVRDSRNDSRTGWVFGTFVYNGTLTGTSPWDRLMPVGLMWGNDPTVLPNGALLESWINPAANLPPQHLGWGKRLNGPVDNRASSCLSCHATAQVPATSSMVPPATLSDQAKLIKWFRNVKAGEAFDAGQTSLDYSLQLAAGIQNAQPSTPSAAPPTAGNPPVPKQFKVAR